MKSLFAIPEEWLRPGAMVPVDAQTTGHMLRFIQQMLAQPGGHLQASMLQIRELAHDANQSTQHESDFRDDMNYIEKIAVAALAHDDARVEREPRIAKLLANVPQFSGMPNQMEWIREAAALLRDGASNVARHDPKDDVQWIVNDNAELGVMVNGNAHFLYKGHSLIYEDGKHDDGTPMMYRPVFKREFGECCHPINHADYSKIGTVSPGDSDEWKPIPQKSGTVPVVQQQGAEISPEYRVLFLRFEESQRQLKEMEERKDGAYEERNKVVAALAWMALWAGWPAGIARTAIEGWSDDWHGCVYIDLPPGQVSWHFHDSHAPLFEGLPPYRGSWDGHDTPEKYRRVAVISEVLNQPEVRGGAPKRRFPTTCLKPDALDSACPCCQRWFYAAYGQYEPPEVQSEVAHRVVRCNHPAHDVCIYCDQGAKAAASTEPRG